MTINTATWVRATAATVMVAAAVTAFSTGASGAGLPTVSQAQKAVDTRIDLRLKTLSALKIAIGGATNLTSDDKSALSNIVSADVSGLTTLRTKTDAETTVAAVKADGRSMVVDYRVYMLVVPKVRFAIASDQESAVITRLQGAHDKLAAIATQLAGQGKDVSPEQAKLADLTKRLAAAKSALAGKASGLLGVAPSPDPAAMKAAVAPVRTAVHSARADLKTALADAKAAGQGLKALA